MSSSAAAVFAQVIPMLFIATFLQLGRFRRSEFFVATAILALAATAISEIILLSSVATETAVALGMEFFVWFAVLFHLMVIVASATSHLAKKNDESDRPADEDAERQM